MNASNAHLFIPLVQALADGKTLQLLHDGGKWMDWPEADFSCAPECYRIKPESRKLWVVLNDGIVWAVRDNEEIARAWVKDSGMKLEVVPYVEELK